jgi:hypothetical protein
VAGEGFAFADAFCVIGKSGENNEKGTSGLIQTPCKLPYAADCGHNFEYFRFGRLFHERYFERHRGALIAESSVRKMPLQSQKCGYGCILEAKSSDCFWAQF